MDNNLIELTTRIVEAHLASNATEAAALPELIASVHGALARIEKGETAGSAEEKPVGAVSARKSLSSPDHIISMIDGKPYRTLKRHLSTHGYDPESYRQTFGLAADYPMVARNYSAQRSEMARAIGLGRKAGQKKGARKRTAK